MVRGSGTVANVMLAETDWSVWVNDRCTLAGEGVSPGNAGPGVNVPNKSTFRKFAVTGGVMAPELATNDP